MVNQASMTGESQPVPGKTRQLCLRRNRAGRGDYLQVEKSASSTVMSVSLQMIEDSELKSSVEGKASNLADALVPWSPAVRAYLSVDPNATVYSSILMVDFSVH